MSTHRQEIIQIIETAQSSIQVAVSWFTDELLIEKLINKAKQIKVELLMSAAEVNILRHEHFSKLQSVGGMVQKIGSDDALLGGFMHSKLIIIDGKYAYGGSYNYTANAQSNYENFDKYETVTKSLSSFKNWWVNSYDFFKGVSNPEEIVKRLRQSFIENEKSQMNWLEKTFSNVSFSEEKYIQQQVESLEQSARNQVYKSTYNNFPTKTPFLPNDIFIPEYTTKSIVQEDTKKETIRETVANLVEEAAKVTPSGVVAYSNLGVARQPHRFHGGVIFSNFSGNKLANSYSLAFYQKYFLEKNYSFLKCRIEKDTLVCVGEIQPENCDKYKFRIVFRAGHYPQVHIISHKIAPRSDIHLYNDGSLCLFFPPETKWKDTTKIAEYTIPWIIEWVLYYEIWKITGKWEGAEKSH